MVLVILLEYFSLGGRGKYSHETIKIEINKNFLPAHTYKRGEKELHPRSYKLEKIEVENCEITIY